MMTKEQKMTAILLQANISLARASHSELRIKSKSYVNRDVRDGYGRKLSEDELLQNEVATHLRHINIAQECLDAYLTEGCDD